MEAIFLRVLNISLVAGGLIGVIILMRIIFRNAPKTFRCAMWALVALRLMCPFSMESNLSFIHNAEPISEDIIKDVDKTQLDSVDESKYIDTGILFLNSYINPIVEESLGGGNLENSKDDIVDNDSSHATNMQKIAYVATIIWIVGMILMLVYCVASYVKMRRKVVVSMKLRDNIYICDNIDTPFILGIIRPRIYLPSTIGCDEQDCVIAHEQAHLKRHDNWWKPLGFLLLSVYWFNPLIWVAYILLCRDIELACDERVIRGMDAHDKKKYSEVLLSCSISRKTIMATPLAFGEVAVKRRIKAVLNYKKPAFWVICIGIIASVGVAIGFMTTPAANKNKYDNESGIDGIGNNNNESSIEEETTTGNNQIIISSEEDIIRYRSLDNMYWLDLDPVEKSCYLHNPMLSISGYKGVYELTHDGKLILTFGDTEYDEVTRVFMYEGDKLIYIETLSKQTEVVNLTFDDEAVFLLSSSDSFKEEIDKVIGEGIMGKKERYVVFASETSINEGQDIVMTPTIRLDQLNKSFVYSFSMLASYAIFGDYEYTEDKLILRTSEYVSEQDGGETYVFVRQGDKFVFSIEMSTLNREPAYSSSIGAPFAINEVYIMQDWY